MTIRPCDEFIDCECSDNPFINTSAEAPDPNLFFARKYFANNPSLNEDDSWYRRLSCLGVCFSEESQMDADDCALRNAQLCTWNDVRPPLTILSDDPPSTPRTNVFGNAAVSCTSPCPEGPAFTFSVPANTFYGLTQQEADAMAQSFCEIRALRERMCSGVPPEPPVCDAVITSVTPPGPEFTLDVEVGGSAVFGVTFLYTGMDTPVFLWLKDGFPLVQTLNPSLVISPVVPTDFGVYRLVIIIPNCPPVLSPNLNLNEIPCSQSGSPIPDPLFSNNQDPQDLGLFVTPLGISVPVGNYPPGIFNVTYVEGAYGHQLGINPCPLEAFQYSGGTNKFVTTGFSVDLLDYFGSDCANTTAEITAVILATGPIPDNINHDGGDVSFITPVGEGIPGAPNPTWSVIYTPGPPPPAANQYQIDNFVEVGPKLVNPSWTDDLILSPWDGIFGDNPGDVVFDNLYIRIGISFGNPANCGTAQRMGNKRVSYTSLEGPYFGSDIRFFFPELGSADVDDGTRYWTMSVQDCCHGGGCAGSGTLGWYGVKEYGDDVDGNYRKIYGAHPEAPDCVSVTKL